MNNMKEKVSYCIGFETGKNLKHQFSDMDFSILIQGFQDGLNNANPKLSQEEIRSILTALRSQVEAQQKQYIAELAEENKKEGEAFLKANKEKEGVITLSSGLQYKILHQGSGNRPSLFDTVSMHYKGQFVDGTVFDSSFSRGKPQNFPVNRVIPGWSEALQLMQVGDKWEVAIPHYLAYGEHGFGSEIGPNTTLIFEMELLGIVPS